MTAVAERTGLRVPRRSEVFELPTWPLAMAFVAYPIWWMFGAAWLAWPIAAVCMLNQMTKAGTWKLPPGFGIWLAYLASTFVSLLEVHGGSSYFSWGFNEVGYLSATVFLLYVYNMRRGPQALPRYLALFWMITIVGGLLGVIAPHAGFTTPMRALLPHSVTNNALGNRFTDLHFGDISGYGNPRPTAPFAYSNRWGSILALTTPIAVVVALRTRHTIRRSGIVALAIVALLPIVYSLDRGLWASIGIAVMYALFRAVRRGQGKALFAMIAGIVGLAILVVISSLHELAINKITNPYSNGGRADSYSASWQGFLQQPWIGHGVTGSSVGLVTNGKVSVGTQGQFWTAIYTGGLLGAVPFFLWFLYVLFKTIHVSSKLAAVYRIAAFLPVPLSFIYGFVPESLMVIVVCQGALLRLRVDDPDSDRPARATLAGAMHRLPERRPAPGAAGPDVPALTESVAPARSGREDLSASQQMRLGAGRASRRTGRTAPSPSRSK